MSARFSLLALALAMAVLVGTRARAQPDAGSATPRDAGAPQIGDAAVLLDAGAVPAARSPGGGVTVYDTCVERLPEGKARPRVREEFQARGTSGHAAVLTVTIEHGKGESVLPAGLSLGARADAAQALERYEFVLPDPDGGAGPTLSSQVRGDRVESTLRLSVVPLPDEAGRHELTLPPLPIALSRASGQIITLCTKPHRITVEDPIANDPDPKPQKNPEPRRQREEWVLAKQVAVGVLSALVVGALLAWLLARWRRRPKKGPPPPPPRPPWEVALEEMFELRREGLVEQERYDEHFDRLSDTVRKYLGGRFGFDGLESTTREILVVLRKVTPSIGVMSQIEAFLREADLVKFARVTPSVAGCQQVLELGEEVVRRTMPLASEAAPAPESGRASEPTSMAFDGRETPPASGRPPSGGGDA